MNKSILTFSSSILALMASLLSCTNKHAQAPIVDRDLRPGIYQDPIRVFTRIQSNLERVAAGKPVHILPPDQRPDALEKIVDAYVSFLSGDQAAMDSALSQVARSAQARRNLKDSRSSSDIEAAADAARVAYFANVDSAATNVEPAVRLIAGLRNVDSTLFVESAGDWPFFSLAERIMSGAGRLHPRNGTWLRLPCRTISGRTEMLSRAILTVKALGGPMFSCPSDQAEPTAIEKLLATQHWTPHSRAARNVSFSVPITQPPSPPWDAATAVLFMTKNPDAADIALKAAATTPVGKLDYALFLHAFREQTPIRDQTIVRLLKEVLETPTDDTDSSGIIERLDKPYDGSDASMASKVALASELGIANTESVYYAIPCDVLVARPGLLEATKERFGGSRDNFLPRSGCNDGRGVLPDFPEAELLDWVDLASGADGHFIDTFDGRMKYGFAKSQEHLMDELRINPRGFLEGPEPPAMDYPYETWGLLSIGNHELTLKLKESYQTLLAKLAVIYQKRGLSDDESRKAAKRGLFAVVYGGDCGHGVPASSPRAALLSGEIPGNLVDLSPNDSTHDALETEACAEFADMDPLIHVAVVNSKALTVMLERAPDADVRDAIGKTPLMVAAQHDLIDSAQLLLAHKADVNATTFVARGSDYALASEGLSHDSRTPLMYAAAQGSLAMIRLLLDAGADPYQSDTKGRRAIDYLLGFSPVDANPHLTVREREQAIGWLF